VWDFDSMVQWLCVCRNGAVAGIAARLPVDRLERYLLLPLAFAFESGACAQCGLMVQPVDARETVQNDGRGDAWQLCLLRALLAFPWTVWSALF